MVNLFAKKCVLLRYINSTSPLIRKPKEELVAKIAEAYASFIADANLQAEKGNKAAGTRARKTSLAIEKLLKEFRKASIDASK